jgi:hypothetical protein
MKKLLILAVPTQKIRTANATSGGTILAAITENAAEIEIVDVHFHHWEIRAGLAASPSGETHRADEVGDGIQPFVPDGGDETWGAWVQILGSEDTPFRVGKTLFDAHQLIITAAERTNVYFIQIACGTSGAQALTDKTYSTLIFNPGSVAGRSVAVNFSMPRCATGTKVWVRILCLGQNTGTLNMYLGLHEYDD